MRSLWETQPFQSYHVIFFSPKDQWFTTDIREGGVQERGQIEESWLKARKIVIKQNICVQVLSAIDISKPAYTQLQEILKVDNANTAVSADGDNSGPYIIFTQIFPNSNILNTG